MSFETAEVIGIEKAFKPSKSKFGQNLKLGAVRIRMATPGGGARIERFAYPLFNFLQVPLIGEHIAIIDGPSDFKNPGTMGSVHYYLGPINLQGNSHLNPLPNAFDVSKAGSAFMNPTGLPEYAMQTGKTLINAFKKYKPGQNFKEKKSILKLQPYEGDVIIEGRHGNSIRLGSSLKGSMSQYGVQPFWQGDQGAPITIISNGHKEESAIGKLSPSGLVKKAKSKLQGSPSPPYGIEKPDDTASILILSSKSQKISMKLAKKNNKIGDGVKKLISYKNPQLIGSSERVILNAKKDDIILIGKKDVKVVTKKWATDMEFFFDQVLSFMDEVIKQNEQLEKLHKEVSSFAQASMTSIHPTGVGPSGPPTNAASFGKTKGKATSGASTTKSLRKKLEKIRDDVKKMNV